MNHSKSSCLLLLPLLLLPLALSACADPSAASTGPAEPPANAPMPPADTSQTPTNIPPPPADAPVSTAGASAAASALPQPLSLSSITAQVKADLVARLSAPIDQLQLLSAEPRTWEDESLGCVIRKGFFEGSPTPGDLIQLGYQGQTYTYHTAQDGRFVLCPNPQKPLGPITR